MTASIIETSPSVPITKLPDPNWVRAQFPSLQRAVNGFPATFLDGPGGTQVPQRVIDAISDYLRTNNANTCGAYATSRYTDQMIAGARSAMADFLGCDSDEIVFGPNMTSLTFAISRAIGRQLGSADEVLVTHLDHDANISPWRALEEQGVKIQFADIHEDDCTLDMEDLASKITSRIKIVAVGYASNAVGTINDVRTIVRLAHEVGAITYIDAVHYAPHGPIDVRELDCDFLACSTYKFFGPHMGVLYGKREQLARLTPYKVRANTDAIPQRWEWGTLNHECLAGITACVEYLAELGTQVGRFAEHLGAGALTRPAAPGAAIGERSSPGCFDFAQDKLPRASDPRCSVAIRRDAIHVAYRAICSHERKLAERMLKGLVQIRGLRLYGISDPARLDSRCPTFGLRIDGHTPLEIATKLGEQGIFTWDGNYYAINLTERLGIEKDGGSLRIGLVHYNTEEEVERVLDALQRL